MPRLYGRSISKKYRFYTDLIKWKYLCIKYRVGIVTDSHSYRENLTDTHMPPELPNGLEKQYPENPQYILVDALKCHSHLNTRHQIGLERIV